MSQTVSSKLPRLYRCVSKIKPANLSSTRDWHHRSRWLPMFRKSPFEDFFNERGPGYHLNENIKTMQRLMDSMIGVRPSVWDANHWVSTRPAARDVQVKYNAKEFEVKMDVESYTPEDLNVKIVGDELSITGKLKATDEHGTITSEFSRKFVIPENVELESLESVFTDDGALLIRGKVKGSEDIAERTIHIKKEPAKEGTTSDKTDTGETK